MKLTSIPQVLSFDPSQIYNNAEEHNLGEAVYMDDGRIFRYALANASADVAVGKIATAPAHITNHDNMACTAAAIGATTVNVTPGATAGAASLYAEGYLVINAGTGLGQTFKVSSHPAIVASTAFNVTLNDPIVVALDTTSKACLVHNSYKNVLNGTTATIRPAGVPLVTITKAYYGWLQTRGLASVLSNGAIAVGNTVVVGATVSGSVDIGSTTYGTFQATMPVGKAVVAGVDTEYRPVWLEID